MADAMDQRPRAVPIVAAFLFAVTVIAAIVGISLLFPNRLMDRLWELNKPGAALFRAMGRISGVFLLALGVATAAAARGLLRRKQWAWWFAVVLFAIDGSGDVVGLFVTGDLLRSLVGVAISLVFLYFLGQRQVRWYFRGGL
jgi:uncharacterized membrane protein (DUF2068 family)